MKDEGILYGRWVSVVRDLGIQLDSKLIFDSQKHSLQITIFVCWVLFYD